MRTYYTNVAFKPASPPAFEHKSREAALRQPYIPCWVDPRGAVVPLTTRGCHLRKGALSIIYHHMMSEANDPARHHSRYYVWDSSAAWNPDRPHSWTPIAEHPRDQWVPSW